MTKNILKLTGPISAHIQGPRRTSLQVAFGSWTHTRWRPRACWSSPTTRPASPSTSPRVRWAKPTRQALNSPNATSSAASVSKQSFLPGHARLDSSRPTSSRPTGRSYNFSTAPHARTSLTPSTNSEASSSLVSARS